MAHKNENEDDYEENNILDNESDDDDDDSKSDDDELLAEAVKRMHMAVMAESQNAIDAVEDDDFMAGRNHWPDDIKREREAEGRPCLTINKLPQFKNQVFNPIRSNTPSIKVRAAAGSSTNKFKGKKGAKEYSQAEVLAGLIKNIEGQSKAKQAYNHATSQAITGGWGYFRIVTEYIEGSFDQEIRIKRIKNRFSVKNDPNASEFDRSDSRFCFISEWIDQAEFDEKWPDASRNDMDVSTGEAMEHWFKDKSVRVSEYYRIVEGKREIALLSDNRVIELNEKNKRIIDELANAGIDIVKKRIAKRNKVEWYKITGSSILEGPVEIPSPYIPVFTVIGTEHILDGEVILEGLVRQAKDSLRQYNYWRTAEIESVALQPKQPFVVGASQLGRYKTQWDRANKDNSSVLIFDDAVNPTPPQRQSPPLASSGNLNAAKAASDDLKSAIGMFDPSIDSRSKEKSGKAIALQEAQSSNGNSHYAENQAVAIAFAGRVLIDMIPRTYDSNRIVRVMFADGSEDDIELFETIVDEETGEEVTVNDLSMGTFNVEVDVGPSYLTKRMEAVDGLMQFFSAVPRAAEIASDLLAKNLDMPEADELQKRLRKTAPAGVIDYADDEEKPPEPQPTPEQQVEMVKAEAAVKTAQATEAKAAASMAESDLKMMELQKAEAGNENKELSPQQIIEIIDQRVEQGISEFIQINNQSLQG